MPPFEPDDHRPFRSAGYGIPKLQYVIVSVPGDGRYRPMHHEFHRVKRITRNPDGSLSIVVSGAGETVIPKGWLRYDTQTQERWDAQEEIRQSMFRAERFS